MHRQNTPVMRVPAAYLGCISASAWGSGTGGWLTERPLFSCAAFAPFLFDGEMITGAAPLSISNRLSLLLPSSPKSCKSVCLPCGP